MVGFVGNGHIFQATGFPCMTKSSRDASCLLSYYSCLCTFAIINSYCCTCMHRRRKILKVGGAEDIVARVKNFDHTHLGSNHAHLCTIKAAVTVQPGVS